MAAKNFWSEADDRHKEIAETFYKNIEIKSPKNVTGRSNRWVDYCGCSWCATCVKYKEYNGPRVTNF